MLCGSIIGYDPARMVGHVLAALAVAYLLWRVRRLERRLVRSSLAWHDAANRAMVRRRRDMWRWRQTEHALTVVAREVVPGFDVPQLPEGPPDDPDSGEV